MLRTANRLIKSMKEAGLTLALAESVTCGFAAHQLGLYKGTSDVLRCSMVVYHPETKTSILKVSKQLIDKHTAESKAVTEELAKKLAALRLADIHAAVTGLASPGGTETKSKPPGTVFYAAVWKKKVYNRRIVYRGTPLEIKQKASEGLYKFILEIINHRI